jgi:hypothetical protein
MVTQNIMTTEHVMAEREREIWTWDKIYSPQRYDPCSLLPWTRLYLLVSRTFQTMPPVGDQAFGGILHSQTRTFYSWPSKAHDLLTMQNALSSSLVLTASTLFKIQVQSLILKANT